MDASRLLKVHAVVVAYRSEALLANCLAGLSAAGVDHVVVLDNSPRPGNAALARGRATELGLTATYVAMPYNAGYARAANVGWALAGPHDLVLIVSPDVALNESFVTVVRWFATSRAALAAGVLRPNDPRDGINVREQASQGRELLRAVLGTRRTAAVTQVPSGSERPVAQLDGCLLLCRKETLSALGGFDERFELYYEDVDLCRRAEAFGGCWLFPLEVGSHLGGASKDQSRGAAHIAFRVSRVRYLRKYHGRCGSVTAVLCALLEYVARTVSRAPEGDAVRLAAVRAQLREVAVPLSQWVLEGARPFSERP